MKDVEELLQHQEELAGWIERGWENLKKKGVDKITISAVNNRLKLIHEYWDEFKQNHRAIRKYNEASSSDYITSDRFQTVEEKYQDCLSELDEQLSKLKVSTTISSGREDFSVPINYNQESLKYHFPKFDLPEFSGDILEWESFRDQFLCLTNNCSNLTKLQKFLLLQSKLKGEAAELIKNTVPSDANYDGAWADLESRYGNKRLLSNHHMKKLLEVSRIEKQSSTEIKRILDLFKQTVRSFNTLDKPIEAWDEWFVYLLTLKLDTETKVLWETSLKNSTEVPKFKVLTEFLENLQHALLSVSDSKSKINIAVKNNVNKPKSSVNSMISENNVKKVSCPNCSGPHNLASCNKFRKLNVEERREVAKKCKVCFNCLFSGHYPGRCQSKFKCVVCNEKHNTLLHGSFSGARKSAISNSKVESNINDTSNKTELNSSELGSSNNSLNHNLEHKTANVVSAGKTVLLAIARVKIVASDGNSNSVRALIDTGSDTSIISEWVVQFLRLSKVPKSALISGFQCKETRGNHVVSFKKNLILIRILRLRFLLL